MSKIKNADRRLLISVCLAVASVYVGVVGFQSLAGASGAEHQRIKQSVNPESKEELIRNTKTILLAETTEKKPSSKPEHFDFKFKVLRVVKGEYKDSNYEMSSVLQSGFGQLISAQGKDAASAYFDPKRNELRMTFGLHEKYLIFVGSKNSFGYQRVVSEKDDQWLKQVEKLARQ